MTVSHNETDMRTAKKFDHFTLLGTLINDDAENDYEKYEFAFMGSFSDHCKSFRL